MREWAYVEALSLVGVPGNSALLISLTTSAFMIALNVVGALFLPAMPAKLRSACSIEEELELDQAEGESEAASPTPSSTPSCSWNLRAELEARELEGGSARR